MPTNISQINAAGGGDYLNLQDWWNDRCAGTDLVATDRIEIAEVTGQVGGLQTSSCTTDATHYAEVRAAAGQEFNPTTGLGARVINSATIGAIYFVSGADFMRLTNMGVIYDHATGLPTSIAPLEIRCNSALVTSCVIRTGPNVTEAPTSNTMGNVKVTAAGANATFRNCIVDSLAGNTLGYRMGFRIDGPNATLHNCLAYDIQRNGYTTPGDSPVVRNCIGMNCPFADFNITGATPTFDYCLSSDGSATGANSWTNQTDAATLTDGPNQDYTVASGSNSDNNGVDLSAFFTTDFLGNIHNADASGWEIGPYDNSVVVAPEGSGSSTFLMTGAGGGRVFTGIVLMQDTADLLAQVLTDLLDAGGAGSPGYVEVRDAGAQLLDTVPLNFTAYNISLGDNTSILSTTPSPPESSGAVLAGTPFSWNFFDGLGTLVFTITGDFLGPSSIALNQPIRITSHSLTWPLT